MLIIRVGRPSAPVGDPANVDLLARDVATPPRAPGLLATVD